MGVVVVAVFVLGRCIIVMVTVVMLLVLVGSLKTFAVLLRCCGRGTAAPYVYTADPLGMKKVGGGPALARVKAEKVREDIGGHFCIFSG
mmetsp:Transcript_5814/g.11524  ORF Transcript_5814/g.11524 Transcript_5814/m.11524 type:complete len:89 (-) Transcript_5814:84-350(-)